MIANKIFTLKILPTDAWLQPNVIIRTRVAKLPLVVIFPQYGCFLKISDLVMGPRLKIAIIFFEKKDYSDFFDIFRGFG